MSDFYLPNIREYINEAALDRVFLEFMDLYEARGRIPTIEAKPRKEEIIKAIENRHYVGIYYEEPEEGKVKAGFRLIEPYAYGKGYKHGTKVSHDKDEYLRVYVIRDTKTDTEFKGKKKFTRRKSVSKSMRKPFWRLMRVDRIQTWETIPRKILGYRSGYNPNDAMISNIIAAAKTGDFSKGVVKAK